MGALITNDGSRDSKPAKQIRSNKIHNNLSIISSGGFGFNSFWNIINSKENINKTKRDREMLIKSIPQTSNTSQNNMDCWGIWCLHESEPPALTRLTSATDSPCILEDGGPIETTVKHLVSCPLYAKMATWCGRMTKLQDRVDLMVWNTSPNNLVTAQLPQIGVIPNIMLSIALNFIILSFRC